MLKDITFGQFFPGNSILHRLDPRVKIISVIFLIVLIFVAEHILAYLLLVAACLVMILIGKIPPKTVFSSLKGILVILLITSLLNLFLTKGEGVPLLDCGPFTVYTEGIWRAIKMFLRITILLIMTSVVLTYTTSPIELTDGIERLLSPLAVFHVPVHDFAMMMSIALRFIPTLIEETDKIMSAQKARGADFSSGGPIKRIKALLPVLIPLFISAFRRAEELATAMECRCYRGGQGRTRMKVLHIQIRDIEMFAVIPNFETNTKKSREGLPTEYSREDVIYNLSRVALLQTAFTSGDLDKIKAVFGDKLHEPYRLPNIKGAIELKSILENLGYAVAISGSGPSLLAVGYEGGLAYKIPKEIDGAKWKVKELKCDDIGAKVITYNF